MTWKGDFSCPESIIIGLPMSMFGWYITSGRVRGFREHSE
jgi:hypothetical protein